jgi:hypothetical protein
VVHDHQYGVIWSAPGQLGNEVEGHHFEWSSVFWNWDAEQWRLLSVRQVFVLLTLRASSDVVFDPRPHTWPPEDLCNGSDRLVSSGVSCRWRVVEPLQDFPSELVVRWHCVHAAPLPEPGVYVVVYRRYFFHMVVLFPEFHGALVLFLAPL